MAIKTVIFKGESIAKEGVAGGSITPGHLIQRNAAGNLVVHGTAAGNAQKSFAKENELAGNGIDIAYAALDRVFYDVVSPGAEINALVAAGALAIVIGDKLESAGDGTVRKLVASVATSEAARASILGEAIEAIDNSAGGAAVRIKMEAY